MSDFHEQVQQLNSATYALAKRCLGPTVDKEALRRDAMTLQARLNELLAVKEARTADDNRMLSESDLELTYAFNEGRGPTTPRVDQYAQSVHKG